MAKTCMGEREKRRRRLVNLKWEKRQLLKRTIISPDSTEEERHEAVVALNKMPRDSSPVRTRNRCALTGRPRGYLRKFHVSRIAFRQMASHGLIPGVTKSSW